MAAKETLAQSVFRTTSASQVSSAVGLLSLREGLARPQRIVFPPTVVTMLDGRSEPLLNRTLLSLWFALFALSALGCKGNAGGPCFQDNECKTGLVCCGATQSNRGICQTEVECEANPLVLPGCGFEPIQARAFRLEGLELDNPGLFEKTLVADGGGAIDCTAEVTSLLVDYLSTVLCEDADEDGVLDQSVALGFDSTERTTTGQTEPGLFGTAVCTPVQDRFVECTAVDGPDGGLVGLTEIEFTIQYSGACIAELGLHEVNLVAGDARGCFQSVVLDELIVPFGGLDIPLSNVTVMGSLVGRPSEVLEIEDGAILGSITPEVAETTILPAELPEPFGGMALSEFLRRNPECELSDLENVNSVEAFVFVFRFDGVGVVSSLED